MAKSTKPAKRPARQRTWEDCVAEGVKDETVVEAKTTDTKHIEDGNKIELIVENFHGVKRATGTGPTHTKARENLVAELKRFTGTSGPMLDDFDPEMNGTETAQALDRVDREDKATREE